VGPTPFQLVHSLEQEQAAAVHTPAAVAVVAAAHTAAAVVAAAHAAAVVAAAHAAAVVAAAHAAAVVAAAHAAAVVAAGFPQRPAPGFQSSNLHEHWPGTLRASVAQLHLQ